MLAKVREILFRYRTTLQSNKKQRPAELISNQIVRIQLEILHPMKHIQNDGFLIKCRNLSVRNRVQVRCYVINRELRKMGKLRYQVQLDEKHIFKHHTDQQRKTEIPKKNCHIHYKF